MAKNGIMDMLEPVKPLAKGLLFIGGLSLGLVGVFNFNPIEWAVAFTGVVILTKVVYTFIGVSAILVAQDLFTE